MLFDDEFLKKTVCLKNNLPAEQQNLFTMHLLRKNYNYSDIETVLKTNGAKKLYYFSLIHITSVCSGLYIALLS